MELNKFDIVKTKVTIPFLVGTVEKGTPCLILGKYIDEQNLYYVATLSEILFIFVISEDQVDFVSSNVLIERGVFDELIESDDKLAALECAGVGDWEGYDSAMEIYESEE